MVQDYSAEIRNHDKRIVISFSCPNDLESSFIVADENRIRQVLCNLIDNAIKFTKEGAITISTEIDNKHNQIIVKVKDTGTGIDSDIIPNLFKKFVTKSDSGTGLGLYICKGIIEAHNGRISAENNSEQDHNAEVKFGESRMKNGATFSFNLPLYYSSASFNLPQFFLLLMVGIETIHLVPLIWLN